VFRDPEEPAFAAACEAVEEPRRVAVDVLYGDHELGQRSITRFALTPREGGVWFTSVARHWNVDRPDPASRHTSVTVAATERFGPGQAFRGAP